MSADKNNLLYLEADTMRGLYDKMQAWQTTKQTRLLSVSIAREEDRYCCIALTNPTEVVITSSNGKWHAERLIQHLGR